MANGVDAPNQIFKLKTWQSIVLGTFLGAALISLIYLISIPPKGQGITLLPVPTLHPIIIHIDGQVNKPGLYTLAPNSRIQDAVTAAGGLTQEAELSQINLAAKLMDGGKIYIPAINEVESLQLPPELRNASPLPTSLLININSATQAELEKLPGIGPTKAAQIISYRETNGYFLTIEDIKKVSGIGDATFETIQNYITVEP